MRIYLVISDKAVGFVVDYHHRHQAETARVPAGTF